MGQNFMRYDTTTDIMSLNASKWQKIKFGTILVYSKASSVEKPDEKRKQIQT